MTENDFTSYLESLGEENVRMKLNRGGIFPTSETSTIEGWLAEKKRAAKSAEVALMAEQTEILRSAKDAAWVSARSAERSAKEAERANRFARRAFFVSILAFLIAALSFFGIRPADISLHSACQLLRLPCGPQ